jgi:YfiH family protein
LEPELPETKSPMCLATPEWSGEKWLVHGFSTRIGGLSQLSTTTLGDWSKSDLNLGYTSNDDPETVANNRRRFLAEVCRSEKAQRGAGALDAKALALVTLKQMHSGLTRRVGRADAAERASLWGDGLMTDEPGVLLGIQTADCLPILVADPKRRAAAAFHAGWRGTLKGVVEQGIEAMGREFGSDPRDLTAAIGPGIGGCCFAVGSEIEDLFRAKYSYAAELFAGQSRLRMNLAEANRRQLLSAGLSAAKVHSLDVCTSCSVDRFFSYRAERGKTGRMMAVVGLRPY